MIPVRRGDCSRPEAGRTSPTTGDPAPSLAAAARRALHRGRRRTDGGHHPEAADGESSRAVGPVTFHPLWAKPNGLDTRHDASDTPDTFAPGLAEWAKGSIMTDELASMGAQALLASLDATDATQTTAAVDA